MAGVGTTNFQGPLGAAAFGRVSYLSRLIRRSSREGRATISGAGQGKASGPPPCRTSSQKHQRERRTLLEGLGFVHSGRMLMG